MENARIFISYRREDTAPYAGRIYDRLVTEFGFGQVFFDIDTIPAGDDFVEVLAEKVESCDVLLAVIGKSWLTIADAAGRPRIQNPDDFVAIEIGAALRRNVRVIPILVGGGRMPRTAELPEALAMLARRQAHELPDKGFIRAVEELFPVLAKSGGALQAGTKKINPRDSLTYIWIPPGTFMMGCSPGTVSCDDHEKPSHQVEISKGFWIGETPVTQEAYQRLMGWNPSGFEGPQRPVEKVSWDEASRFSEAAGVRLPTEAEWEYASRAESSEVRYGDVSEIAWHRDNSQKETHDVKSKRPNGWGLFDMLGNVEEWVADWFDESYYARSEIRDPAGPKNGISKVVRGGSWNVIPARTRASKRKGFDPTSRLTDLGFRCVGELN
jgi:formylglycine-generating enzyme required for sulfatase activity